MLRKQVAEILPVEKKKRKKKVYGTSMLAVWLESGAWCFHLGDKKQIVSLH